MNLRTMGLAVPIATALDPRAWRANYVQGIPLGADSADGLLSAIEHSGVGADELSTALEELPDDVIRWHLRTALSELQVKLGIPLGIVTIKSPPLDDGLVQGVHYDMLQSRRPYTHGEGERWYRIDVPGPVISVERIRGYYYGTLVWEFSSSRGNLDLIRVEWPNVGSMHLLPINLQSIIVTNTVGGGGGNYGVWHTLGLQRSPVPDFWGVDYTIGPVDKETGQPAMLELVLVNWVFAVAGQMLLSIAGMARTRGVTNASVSFDGLSRTVGLAANGQNGLYGALEAMLKRAEDRIDWKSLRAYKRGLRVRMFSH